MATALRASSIAALALALPACTATPAEPPADDPAVFTCTATTVWDGDGPIWCEEGPRIRLHGIAAREIDGECKQGHPCPPASGTLARDALVALLGGATGRLSRGHVTIAPIRLSCRSDGASYSRTGADCTLPNGRDLSCAMVATGTAFKWPRYWEDKRCP